MVNYTYFLLPLMLSLMAFLGSINNNRLIIKATLLMLFFISASRYNVGGDYSNYYFIFKDINSGDVPPLYNTEPLFVLLNLLIGYFKLPFNFLFVFSDGVFLYAFYKIVISFKRSYWFVIIALFLFSYDAYWSLLIYTRQQIALAFIIFAVMRLNKKDGVGFFAYIVIASLFHNPAIVCVSFYFLKRSIERKTLFLIFSLMLLSTFLVNILLKTVSTHYSFYIDDAIASSISVGYLVKVFVFIVGLYYYKNFKGLLYNLFIVGQFLSLLKLFLPILFRFEIYFIVFHVIGLCSIFIGVNRVNKLYIPLLLIGMCFVYNILSLNKTIANKDDSQFWSGYKLVFFSDKSLYKYDNKHEYRESFE